MTVYPYRVWCKHCLDGQGQEFRNACHRGRKEASATPVVSFDLSFVSGHGDITTQEGFEAADEGDAKLVIVRTTRATLFAHVVPSKGIDQKGSVVEALGENVKRRGYNKITLEGDNGLAGVELFAEALRELRIQELQHTMEHSPEHDPHPNRSVDVTQLASSYDAPKGTMAGRRTTG